MVQKSIERYPMSRPFLVDEWRGDEADVTIAADERERGELAAAFGLPAIAELTAEFRLRRRGGGRVEVRGRMEATVTQVCVVSLDPFESRVVEPIEVTFAPEAEARAAEARLSSNQELHGSGSIDEPPDPIVDGRIDLGALAAEFLALGLDPYPRKPGVDFTAPPEATAPADSPFSALDRLKGTKRSGRT